jgi:hypothetical protein
MSTFVDQSSTSFTGGGGCDGNDHSVHPVAIGRRIEVTADLGRVRVFCGGAVVADHPRVWAKHQTISDPAHVPADASLTVVPTL